MNAKQRDRHEWKMYNKALRYGARYKVRKSNEIKKYYS